MRSPWLSREYKKMPNIVAEKTADGYKLFNPKLKNELVVSENEYERFKSESLNEIEWEKYFLRGMAKDVNGEECVFEKLAKLPTDFEKSDKTVSFQLKPNDKKCFILLNPEIGSWAALTEDEFNRYTKNKLNQHEWESLFIRGLAKSKDGWEFEVDTPAPAEYPSVVVVNITTNCNLRCKYCFADCGDFVGEDMQEEVMIKTIENMLAMPVKMTTFEFQGGEASTNIKGMKKFIELAEKMKKGSGKIVKYRTEMNFVEMPDELIDLIKKYNVGIGVSLDGTKEMNDKYRVDENGNGSFDRIMKSIEKIRKNNIPIDGCVCTVGQHNVKYPKEIAEFFNSLNISYKPRPINVLGREVENKLTTKTGEWAKFFIECNKIKENVDIDIFSNHIYEENVYTPIRDYICLRYPCGAARELVSVNPNGDVFPCDGFKGSCEFLMGNILKESLHEMLKNPKTVKLRDRKAKDIKQCSKCMFRAMCCSCCYSAYGKFGDIYREDPHCADRRQIFLYLIQSWLEQNNF